MQSTDENPDYGRCHVGQDSWCGFQRDVAKDTTTYTKKNSDSALAAKELGNIQKAPQEN